MKKFGIALAFISYVGWRIVVGQGECFVAGTRVRVVVPTIDYPEYSESKTIIRRGEWVVKVPGYIEFMPGEEVEVEGVVDESGAVLAESEVRVTARQGGGVDAVMIQVARLRHWAVARLQRALPEPHASLAAGILFGVKQSMPRKFFDQLVETGTLHVVAASGYNVSVVASLVQAVLGQVLSRNMALGGAGVMVGLYVLLAGGSPAIVRAGIMGILGLIGVGLGRVREAKRLLTVSCVVMLGVKPALGAEVGFQLSVAATLGILYIVPLLLRLGKARPWQEYLYPTLGATLATAPVIYWHFGRVSLIGVLVNMLVLPVVPGIMLLAALTLVLPVTAYLLYVPLWWVVAVVEWFS